MADISRIKGRFKISEYIISDFNRAICLGVRLSDAVLEEIKDAPTKLYFHHYKTANMFLDQMAFRVTNIIQSEGFKAIPVPASQIVDWEKQEAHLSHKKLGVLAGLGWIGRNNLLVNKRFGSRFRLVSILTNLDVKAGKPTDETCGDCRECIKACPAGAIKEDPKDFDHVKCFEKLKDFQKQRIVGQYICGVCVKFCRIR